jgi:outer membrane protein OmpA-like peptidoglycan-associated protein
MRKILKAPFVGHPPLASDPAAKSGKLSIKVIREWNIDRGQFVERINCLSLSILIQGGITMKKALILFLSAALFFAMGTGCAWNKKATGAVVGATAGAAVGGVIGNQYGNTAVGAIIGAAVGGAAGTLIGNEMDKRAAEMREDLEGARIQRIGEGIKITFDSGLLFDVNKSDLRPESKTNIDNLANILIKYPDTDILIEGDTDNTGTEEYNVTLSERRAQSVANHLMGIGVPLSRISMIGLGESNPIASNETEYGRQQNRRVEVAIFANDELKKAAEKQAGLN